MALSDIQKDQITKADLNRRVSLHATKINNLMGAWKEEKEFLDLITSGDLTTLGYTAAAQTDLSQFRIFLGELVSLFENNAVTPTNDPQVVVNDLRT